MNPAPTNEITVLLRSRESAERTVRNIIDRQIAREALIATRDKEVQAVLAKHNPRIDDATLGIDTDFELLETWAGENREEFGAAKSLVISGHRIGWRTGNPKVETRGKLTFKTIVAQLIKAGGELKAKFVREKPELNKDAVLELNRVAEGRSEALKTLSEEDKAKAIAAAVAALRELGVRVTQTENFYLEPDREGQPELRMTGEEKEAA